MDILVGTSWEKGKILVCSCGADNWDFYLSEAPPAQLHYDTTENLYCVRCHQQAPQPWETICGSGWIKGMMAKKVNP